MQRFSEIAQQGRLVRPPSGRPDLPAIGRWPNESPARMREAPHTPCPLLAKSAEGQNILAAGVIHSIATTQDVADLLRAVASLAWPAVAFAALLLFRTEFAALLRRLRRGRAAGVELDFGRELSELEQSADDLQEAVPETPAVSPEVEPATSEAPEASARILDRAAQSPKAALMLLSAELERRSREAVSTRAPDIVRGPWMRQLRVLELSPSVRAAAEEFRLLRNQIVHGGQATDDDALRAIDAGLMILRALERVPHEVNVVIQPKVDCFADADGNQQHDFQAVLLAAEHPPDGEVTERAFPHTGPPLPEGEAVTWEWRSGRTFPESWYRDPRSGELRYGWTSALEFAGRPLHRFEP